MDDKQFKDLEQGLSEAVKISKGEMEPARVTTLVDIKAFREHFGLTLKKFSELVCGGSSTVRKWESGDRSPTELTQKVLKLLLDDAEFYALFENLNESDIEDLDAKKIRESLGLTQVEFAKILSSSLVTIQKWEQKIRKPTGLTRKMLKIISEHPEYMSKLSVK